MLLFLVPYQLQIIVHVHFLIQGCAVKYVVLSYDSLLIFWETFYSKATLI